jgi:type II secretory pathway component PulF
MTQDVRDFAIWALFVMLPLTGGIFIAYFCLTLPARRNQRARLFLDLLETGLRNGQSPERTIVAVSETHERIVSPYFHLVAALIEEGARLEHALVMTPRFLPREIAEVVKIGARENELARLLPAARTMLMNVNSRLRGALNYVVVFAFVIVPGVFFFLPMLSIFIWPKLKAMIVDMEATPPAFSAMIFDNAGIASTIQLVFLAVIILFGLSYVLGSRMHSWNRAMFGAFADRLSLLLPWRRYRTHRDFTAVLAILLDAGVREEQAVQLAAQASANDVFVHRAKRVTDKLREGVSLPDALKEIERSPEFQWRWANALRTGRDFFGALRGWHEALETRAFQKEQAAAHAITSFIVVINGLVVGSISAAVFLILISLIEEGTLW